MYQGPFTYVVHSAIFSLEQLLKLVKDLHAQALRSQAAKQEWEDKVHLQMEEVGGSFRHIFLQTLSEVRL